MGLSLWWVMILKKICSLCPQEAYHTAESVKILGTYFKYIQWGDREINNYHGIKIQELMIHKEDVSMF